MNVLMVEPGKAPYVTDIGNDLRSMQQAVGGYIQAVYPYEEAVVLVCNEEGKLDACRLTVRSVMRMATSMMLLPATFSLQVSVRMIL